METEIEIKFLDIDTKDLREKMKSLGGTEIHPEILMKRRVFDYPDERLRKIAGWVRVRDEGQKITLSYKQLNDRTLHGTKEVTVVIDTFEKGCLFCESIGLVSKSYQETKREKWTLGASEITFDTWPWIPTFVEIESPNEAELKAAVTQLGFDWKDGLHGSVETAYQKYFDVTEDEIDSWKIITFTSISDQLEEKRKK